MFVEKLWPEFKPWDMLKILVNWGFNKYWYGNSSGFGLNPRTLRDLESNTDLELFNLTPHVGFERRSELDDDEEEEDTDVSSQLGTEEETMTSEDDADAKVNTKIAQ